MNQKYESWLGVEERVLGKDGVERQCRKIHKTYMIIEFPVWFFSLAFHTHFFENFFSLINERNSPYRIVFIQSEFLY